MLQPVGKLQRLGAARTVWLPRRSCGAGGEKVDSKAANAAAHQRLVAIGKAAAIGAGLGAGILVATPALLGAVGFTSTGIVAASLAAKMMSAAAVANGGGVAAGGVVATLQSFGAVGLPLATKIGLMSVTTGSGAVVGAVKNVAIAAPSQVNKWYMKQSL